MNRLYAGSLSKEFVNFWEVPNLLLQKFPAEVFTPYALLSEAFRILLVSSTCSDILSVSYQPYRHLSSCLKTIFKSSVFQVPYFQYF